MSSFKKLSKADVTTVPYAANKRWDLTYNGTPNDEYAVGFLGRNRSFSSLKTTTTNGQYQALVYASINHLFYQQYSSSLDTGSLMFNVNTYESASQQRPTASYFNYNTNPLFIPYLLTGSNQTVGVLSINQDIYGSKILPNSFQISSSAGDIIKDDGNGNLYEISQAQSQYVDLNWVTLNYIQTGSLVEPGVFFIGNIFYAHGIATFTSGSYTSFITGATTKSISFQNEHIIYENEVRCIVKESDYNLSYNPTLVTGNYESGSLRGFATSASFQPYATTIGLYNDDNDLLMVAKLVKPIVLSSDTDMTFIVKYDT